jgi:hypothetical protein
MTHRNLRTKRHVTDSRLTYCRRSGTIIRGLAGTITYAPAAITVHLDRPRAPQIARALMMLIEEISYTPPVMPSDTRPITYRLTRTRAFNSARTALAGDLVSPDPDGLRLRFHRRRSSRDLIHLRGAAGSQSDRRAPDRLVLRVRSAATKYELLMLVRSV